MFLKRLDITGFKSFAQHTQLNFEPGLTAIVGPNGCGKSNVTDAIRWVLGEQSAKALRGAKMEDCIFNGTDTQKPMSMAAVSLTLAGCQEVLETEYDEVTVTRRVLRSGEGHYFINRSPCRLKDIQRLFMDTGVGTNSYSLMEQGRIDLILSSHPEDRRAVFEEASGITKYKADKKEALRKLDHTEANLLRLNDIIREVKRQIGSLQRQAGKARRYKALQEEVRGLEIYATKDKIATHRKETALLETQQVSIHEQQKAVRTDLHEVETLASRLRSDVNNLEDDIAEVMNASVKNRSEHERTQQLIHINRERIEEIQVLSERDAKDVETAKQRLREQQAQYEEIMGEHQTAQTGLQEKQQSLETAASRLRDHDKRIDTTRQELQDLRAESVDLESNSSRLQNELSTIDAEERATVIRRERLAAEQAETQRAATLFAERLSGMEQQITQYRSEVRDAEQQLDAFKAQYAEVTEQRKDVDRTMFALETDLAGKRAQWELLADEETNSKGLSSGAQHVLDTGSDLPIDRQQVWGPLAHLVDVEEPYHVALQVALRPWLDAVVIQEHDSSFKLLQFLQQRKTGSVRLLTASRAPTSPSPSPNLGLRLLDVVQCAEKVRPLMEWLLRHVWIVENLGALPHEIPAGHTVITRDGAVIRGDGVHELWVEDMETHSPLAHKHLKETRATEIDGLESELQVKRSTLESIANRALSLDENVKTLTHLADEKKRQLALQEGEHQLLAQEARQADERAETVSDELNILTSHEHSGTEQRQSVLHEIEKTANRLTEVRTSLIAKTEEIRGLEQQRTELVDTATEARVRFSESKQHIEGLEQRKQNVQYRIDELASMVRNRAERVHSHSAKINDLEQDIAEARERIPPLEEEGQRYQGELEALRRQRSEHTAKLKELDEQLRQKHDCMDEIRNKKSEIEVKLTETRLQAQNIIERISAEYNITEEQLLYEPEPEWQGDAPPEMDALEISIAEIKAKLESMGPVNLIAIEEYKELEERFSFLSQQEQDLIKAKQQLMDMIRHINKTTTELFTATFEQVNANFQELFKKLFGGGSAKLVLVNEEEILESGIEIIARPPGKKLQTVSLLSGGERTMTAVGLLFALYQVKPGAFCVLDELDAALDDANIGRFISMLQEFLKKSQFIVITHNRQTIEAADILYGVTMQKRGVSNLVSVKLSPHGEPGKDAISSSSAPPEKAASSEPALT